MKWDRTSPCAVCAASLGGRGVGFQSGRPVDAASGSGAQQGIGLGAQDSRVGRGAQLCGVGGLDRWSVGAWRQFNISDALNLQHCRSAAQMTEADPHVSAMDTEDLVFRPHPQDSDESRHGDSLLLCPEFAARGPFWGVEFCGLWQVIPRKCINQRTRPPITIRYECPLASGVNPSSLHGADELTSHCDALSLPCREVLKELADRGYC